MKLYRPSPASRALYVSDEDLGDLTAVVLEDSVVISPANAVLTHRQLRALEVAARAAPQLRNGATFFLDLDGARAELVEGFPPEWRDQVEPEEVPA